MHAPDVPKLLPKSDEWQKKADRLLNVIQRAAKRASPASADSVALMIRGAYSFSSDPSLNAIASLFPPTTRIVYFNYNGPGEREYWPKDTISDSLTTYANRLADYFGEYSRARFQLVCHSLGGLIAMKFIWDRLPDEALWSRIDSIYLLAVPIHLDGRFC